jgi:spermidine dehydrogenase
MGQPGFAGLKLAPLPDGVLDELPGTQHGRQKAGRGGSVHYPDGNASIARLLVRWLNPEAVPGTTQEDLGKAQVKYDLLDRPNQTARLRLSSTVIHARNEGPKGRETGVVLTYSKGDKLYNVRGKACVMASWNMMIPYMVPDLPEEQKKALAYAVKGPLVYTNVAVKNWQAFKTAGISSISAPSMYHTGVSLTEAVGLGDLEFPQSPDEPIFLHLTKVMAYPGSPRQEQHKMGRQELLVTSFETFERSIREQLDRMLGPSGFVAKRDIVSIIVNRWPHGYAYTYNGLNEPLEWVYTASPNRPCVIARQIHGLIAIANSDAGASPHTDTAMWEGHRAVDEILNRRAMPYLA